MQQPRIRIVRGRDVGDSYNYASPEDDVLVETPDAERVAIVEDGPVRTVVVEHRAYLWDGRRVATQTRYEQRVHERFVRVRISFDNPCDNQRIRAHVQLPQRTQRTFAEGQFAVVERGPRPEGGYGEEPVGTYPANAFVVAGGIALLFPHVTEYELVEDGTELAVTILRSIGLISRSVNRFRADPAGPELPIPAAQMRGPWLFEFAISQQPESALEDAEAYRLPFLAVPGSGNGQALVEHAGPELRGATLSSLRRRNEALEARIVNETSEPTNARLGTATADLRAWEIRTLTL